MKEIPELTKNIGLIIILLGFIIVMIISAYSKNFATVMALAGILSAILCANIFNVRIEIEKYRKISELEIEKQEKQSYMQKRKEVYEKIVFLSYQLYNEIKDWWISFPLVDNYSAIKTQIPNKDKELTAAVKKLRTSYQLSLLYLPDWINPAFNKIIVNISNIRKHYNDICSSEKENMFAELLDKEINKLKENIDMLMNIIRMDLDGSLKNYKNKKSKK
ncbi:MAG: hypothetical protein LBG46_06330 [Elusimicrobiota bacterium]|jgi:hypothetical protein|nr:hypothetical protein [Elusimicrobiota bacterium]